MKPPKTQAAGTPAVLSSLHHVFLKSGPVRGTKALLELNQFGGFDCPSCAWPDPNDHRSLAEFCENGAKAIASEAMSLTIDRHFFARHSVADLRNQSDAWHDLQGRLAEPLYLAPGDTHYRPISWDDAFQLIARELHALPSPDAAIFYTSGRASNEAAFLWQAFARTFGTNNLPDCSNMCHESSSLALREAIGVGKGTVQLDDFLSAETILCVGQNPGTNHPRMLTTLAEAVRRGAQLIAINPLREAGLLGFAHPQHLSGLLGFAAPLASSYLQVRPNGDMALFRGLSRCLIESGHADHSFIDHHTSGFQAWHDSVLATPWEEIETRSGISRDQIAATAATLARGEKRAITCWAMGLTQHRNAVATLREITNLHLLLGAIGRPGAGLCPVRGHSNVQGDRTMGIWEKMPEPFLQSLENLAACPIPRHHGFDTIAALQAMHQGHASVFLALGGNFLQACPDTAFTATALSRCTLTAHISTKLNRSHLTPGTHALILPCLGRSEIDAGPHGPRWITTENSMGVIQSSQGHLTPASPHLLSEISLIARLAHTTLGPRGRFQWLELGENYDLLRNLIAEVLPDFSNYSSRASQPGGFTLPNPASQRLRNTPTQRANFANLPLDSFTTTPGRLILQTLRSHDQFNTTIYGLNDRYRGISGMRNIIFLSPHDLQQLGLRPGQSVDITSHAQDGERHLHNFRAIPYDMPQGAAAAYFPEANALVPLDHFADGSHTPASKSIEISLRPSASTPSA